MALFQESREFEIEEPPSYNEQETPPPYTISTLRSSSSTITTITPLPPSSMPISTSRWTLTQTSKSKQTMHPADRHTAPTLAISTRTGPRLFSKRPDMEIFEHQPRTKAQKFRNTSIWLDPSPTPLPWFPRARIKMLTTKAHSQEAAASSSSSSSASTSSASGAELLCLVQSDHNMEAQDLANWKVMLGRRKGRGQGQVREKCYWCVQKTDGLTSLLLKSTAEPRAVVARFVYSDRGLAAGGKGDVGVLDIYGFKGEHGVDDEDDADGSSDDDEGDDDESGEGERRLLVASSCMVVLTYFRNMGRRYRNAKSHGVSGGDG